MSTSVSLAFVPAALEQALTTSKVYPYKQQSAVGVLDWCAPLDAMHKVSPNMNILPRPETNKIWRTPRMNPDKLMASWLLGVE